MITSGFIFLSIYLGSVHILRSHREGDSKILMYDDGGEGRGVGLMMT